MGACNSVVCYTKCDAPCGAEPVKKETETTLFTTEATQQKQHTTQNHSILIRCHFGPLLVFATCIGVRTLHVTVAVRC